MSKGVVTMKKLFGRSLFSTKEDLLPELYDFAKHGLIREVSHIGMHDINLMKISGDDERSEQYLESVNGNNNKADERAKKKKEPKTPKEVYALGTLNDDSYALNIDEEYIQKNIVSLEKKLKLLPDPDAGKKKSRKKSRDIVEHYVEVASYGASKNGRHEMQSMIDRLGYRREYKKYQSFFDQYPYTRSDLINDVLSAHTNLRSKRVEEFIPDMPDDAIDHMNDYNEQVVALTGRKAVFYIIADKKDFGEIDKKRDPILLAQSPFSLAWQVLGAWDEEMIYLGDL